MTDPKAQALIDRLDSYRNAITGLDTDNDKSTYTTFEAGRRLLPPELGALYTSEAIAARIVDRVVDDATRASFTVEDLDTSFDFGSVRSELEDLDALNAVGDAWRWSRLYGGALVIMGVSDGRKFDQPMDMGNVRRLNSLSVVDATTVIPAGFNPKLGSRSFGNPETYEIVVPFGSERIRHVHKSRVLRFDGLRVPPNMMIQHGGWGPSVLQRTWRDIKRLGTATGYAENLLHEISTMVLGMEGLRDMLCGSDGGTDQVKTLLRTLKWGVDNLNIMALDAADRFDEVKRSVDGVAALIDKFVDGVVRATSMPRLIILGESPSGINSSTDGEIRGWYDSVSAEQEQKLTPALNRLLDVVLATRRNSNNEDTPSQWTIGYQSLVQEAPETAAQTNFLMAQTAQILTVNGFAAPDEMRDLFIDRGAIVPAEVSPDGEDEET